MKRALFATAALAIGLVVAVPLTAQPMRGNPDGPGPDMMAGPWAGGPGGFGRICRNTDAKIAGALAYGEKRLGITDQQRAAWNSFADQVRASEPKIRETCDAMQANRQRAERPALPERMQHMETMLTVGLETLQRIRPAATELYNQLTAEQKQVVDSMMGPHHRFGRGPGGWGPGGWGPGGWGPGRPGTPAQPAEPSPN